MWELLLLSVCASSAMLGAATHYYKQVQKTKAEYSKAKDLIGDVIVSFNKQLENQERKLNTVAYKTEIAFSRVDTAYRNSEEHEKKLAMLHKKMEQYSFLEDKVMSQLKELHEKIRDITESQKVLADKVSELEKAKPKPTFESGIKTVIPIKREKALAPLNDTELIVLKILAEEGEKSAPQIKARINLSREHTARLMKKLYEEGYLERNTQKIPYTYKIKEEMRSLLEKVES